MKLVISALLFVGASFAYPNSHLLSLHHSSVLSSVEGLVTSFPSLVNNPTGAVVSIVGLVTAASSFSQSMKTISETVNDLCNFISKSPNAPTVLTQCLDPINNALDTLIAVSSKLSEAVHDVTDDSGNLNMFDLEKTVQYLQEEADAEFDLSAAIQARLNGIPAASFTNIEDLDSKVKATSEAKSGLIRVADDARGITGFIFGTTADLIGVNGYIAQLSENLFKLARTIGATSKSNPSLDKLVIALKDLADTESKISVYFDRSNNLD